MTIQALLSAVSTDLGIALTPVQGAEGHVLASECRGVTSDSRAVVPGGVFVALQGQKFDGTQFVPEAVVGGAALVVSQRTPTQTDVAWVVVPDARAALASLAANHYGQPSRQLRVVGITGTNGKTTTSYLLRSIVQAAGARCGLLGTVVHSIGDRDLPASRTTPEAVDVQRLMRDMVSAGCTSCVMEVSSHALALKRVDGVHFAAGVFTNLTRDHLDFHGDMEHYFAAKRRLFEMLPSSSPAVINADDPKGPALLGIASRTITYGVTQPADIRPGPLSFSIDGLCFDVHTPTGTVPVRSRLVGRVNVYNILAAIGAAVGLGIPLDDIVQGVAALDGVPGRFEVVSGRADDISVVIDYAHTDDALRNLLETAKGLASRRLITVFGAGGERDRSKRPLMGMVAARLSDLVVITSDNPRSEDPTRIIEDVRRGAEPETRRGVSVASVVDRGEAIAYAIGEAVSGDMVLIAGKGHEKTQETGGRSVPFDDAAVARAALAARRVKAHAV